MAGEPLAGLWIFAALPSDHGLWGEAVLPLLLAQLAAGHHTLSQLGWLWTLLTCKVASGQVISICYFLNPKL